MPTIGVPVSTIPATLGFRTSTMAISTPTTRATQAMCVQLEIYKNLKQ